MKQYTVVLTTQVQLPDDFDFENPNFLDIALRIGDIKPKIEIFDKNMELVAKEVPK